MQILNSYSVFVFACLSWLGFGPGSYCGWFKSLFELLFMTNFVSFHLAQRSEPPHYWYTYINDTYCAFAFLIKCSGIGTTCFSICPWRYLFLLYLYYVYELYIAVIPLPAAMLVLPAVTKNGSLRVRSQKLKNLPISSVQKCEVSLFILMR